MVLVDGISSVCLEEVDVIKHKGGRTSSFSVLGATFRGTSVPNLSLQVTMATSIAVVICVEVFQSGSNSEEDLESDLSVVSTVGLNHITVKLYLIAWGG